MTNGGMRSTRLRALLMCLGSLGISVSAQADGIGLRIPGTARADETVTDVNQAIADLESDPAIRSLVKRSESNQFVVSGMAEGSGVKTTRFKHLYHGLEVIGSQAFHHVDAEGKEIRSVITPIQIDTNPRLDANAALSVAVSYLGTNLDDGALKKKPALKILSSRTEDSARLVWIVETQDTLSGPGAVITLDANSGELISHVSKHLELASVRVFTAQRQGLVINMKSSAPSPFFPGGMSTGCDTKNIATGEIKQGLDILSCNRIAASSCQTIQPSGNPLQVNPFYCREIARDRQATLEAQQDISAQNAWKNAVQTLQYFSARHQRDSFDNRGTPIVSVVHVGGKMANAFWSTDQKFMAYGDGDGTRTRDFSVAADVAGHEMTHGVIQATAQLGHTGETASLNEAYADFFGKMVEGKGSWVVGEELLVNKIPGQGIRNLETPGVIKGKAVDPRAGVVSAPYPSRVSEMAPNVGPCTPKNDYCNAHFNATVPGHTAYLMTKTIGVERTEKLYYLTMSQFLNSTATFNDSALATLAACRRLYDSSTCTQVQGVFASTGMLQSGQRGFIATRRD